MNIYTKKKSYLLNKKTKKVLVDFCKSKHSAGYSHHIKDVIIPPNQSLRVINGGERLVLGTSNTLSIVTNTAASVDAIVSLVEIV